MQSVRLKLLRVTVIVMLVLLALQYELGMVVNMSDPQAIPPFPFSIERVSEALRGVGTAALIHAGFGGLLVLVSLVVLVMSWASRVRSAQIFGTLGLLSILFAATGGLMFVLSGFQKDGSSHSMATNFLLAFTFYFVELYSLKGEREFSTKATKQPEAKIMET